MAGKTCNVSYKDAEGVRHTVEVQAESVYEASVIALSALKDRSVSLTRRFTEALGRVPGHAMVHAGIALAGGCVDVTVGGSTLDEAMAKAALRIAAGDAPGAAQLVAAALTAAPAGNAGWLLAVEPLLAVRRDRAAWASALAHVRARAL